MGKNGRLLGHAEDEHDPEGGDGAEDADVEEEQVQLSDVVGRVQIADRQQLGCKQTMFIISVGGSGYACFFGSPGSGSGSTRQRYRSSSGFPAK